MHLVEFCQEHIYIFGVYESRQFIIPTRKYNSSLRGKKNDKNKLFL